MIQAWFGSIVVASNLVPWTITIHMLLALLIIALQIFFIKEISPIQSKTLPQSKLEFYLIWICLGVTFYQMFLGTQVRESIDELTCFRNNQRSMDSRAWFKFLHSSKFFLASSTITVLCRMEK